MNSDPLTITREIFFNVGGPNSLSAIIIYIPFIIILSIFAWRIVSKIKLWNKGQPEKRYDHLFQRYLGLFTQFFAQLRIFKRLYSGIMHAAIVWGFIILFIGTLIILIQENATIPLFGQNGNFIYGNFYLTYSLILDLFGLIAVIGTLLAIFRRLAIHPKNIDSKASDYFALFLILIILISGFYLEGARIAITNFPAFEVYSPVGWIIAKGISNLGITSLILSHKIVWWFHFSLTLLFILALTQGKLLHIITASINIFFRNLKHGRLTLIPSTNFETAKSFGVSQINDFTWKQILDLDACTRCGRCDDICPATLTNKPLKPQKIIQDLRRNLYDSKQTFLPIINKYVAEEEIWACTNCKACEEECPVFIEHIQKITDIRRNLVLMHGKMDESLQKTLKNIETRGNPYGIGIHETEDFIESLDVKIASKNANFDYLYFIGCSNLYNEKNRSIVSSFVKVLKQAKIDFAILGNEETCCGDTSLRAGNDYLFQMQAKKNIELFKKYNVEKILTTCPHGYNNFKKEYTDLGLQAEIIHHTEFIDKLLKKKKLNINKKYKDKKITYHDPCFLGRYNSIYNAPREIIKSIGQLRESRNIKEKSFCCGGGGSQMWLDKKSDNKINHMRFNELAETGSDLIVTTCPFCKTMLEDARNDIGVNKIEIKDIIDLI